MLNVKQLLAKMLSLNFKEYAVGTVGRVEARRTAHIVTILIYSHTGRAYSTGWTTLCTIDEEYRPASRSLGIIYDNSSSTAAKAPMIARIETTGEVQVWKFSDNVSSNTPCGTIIYLV